MIDQLTTPAGHGRDETADLTADLCRRIEYREWVTEPERAALGWLVSHVAAARTVITRGDAALGDEVDRALHARGVWRNVDAALGVLLDVAGAAGCGRVREQKVTKVEMPRACWNGATNDRTASSGVVPASVE